MLLDGLLLIFLGAPLPTSTLLCLHSCFIVVTTITTGNTHQVPPLAFPNAAP
jgi:hypothetical protein